AAVGGAVDRAVRQRLRTVEHGDDAAPARFAADVGHGIDGAEHVADVGDGKHLDGAGHFRAQHVHVEAAVVQQVHDVDARARALGDQLPGHDVGVVLHAREQDHVAGAETRQRPGVGHQVDREGGAAGQDQVVGPYVDEARKLRPRLLVGLGRLAAELVHGAADVGVVAAIEAVDGFYHRGRLLPGIGRIEIHQRL